MLNEIVSYLLLLSDNVSGWQFFSIGGYGLKLADFAILALIILFFKKYIIDAQPLRIYKNPIVFLFIIHIGFLTISGIFPYFVGDGDMIKQFFKSLLHLYYIVFMAMIFFVNPPSLKTINNFIRIILIASIFINIFGVYQLFARLYDLPFAFITFTNISLASHGLADTSEGVEQVALQFENFYRATSIFSEPSSLASFNIYAFIYMVVPRVFGIEPFIKNKTLNIVIIVCIIIGLFVTFSLTGLVNISLVLFAILVLNWKKFSKYLIPGLISISVIVLISDRVIESYFEVSIIELFTNRISSLASLGQGKELMTGESVLKRFDTMMKAFDVWLISPFIGVGLGQTSMYYAMTGYSFFDSSFSAILAESGIFSIVAYILLVFFWLRRSYLHLHNRILKESSPIELQRMIYVKFFMLLVIFFCTFTITNAVIMESFWIVYSLYLAIETHISRQQSDSYYSIKLRQYSLAQLIRKTQK